MKHIRMPSSYAELTEEEKFLLGGGGAFGDAWSTFKDNLAFNDFFFGGGLLSFSISFVPMLLFNVVKTGFSTAEKVYQFLFGGPSKAATDVQTYTDNMRIIGADYRSQREK